MSIILAVTRAPLVPLLSPLLSGSQNPAHPETWLPQTVQFGIVGEGESAKKKMEITEII